jgi:hypothetical protein
MKPASLSAMIAVLLPIASGAEARTTEVRTPLGAFTLVEEVSVLEPDELPIMHVDQDWTKLHLVFRTADKLTKVEIIDDGSSLEIAIEAGRCLSRTYPFGYDLRPRGEKLHRAMEASLDALFKLCRTLSEAQKSRHLTELRQSRPEFGGALEAMKARSTAVFGGWRRRCTKYSSRRSDNPFWGPDCVRYSARSN